MGRLDLLLERARVTSPFPECELIAKGVVAGRQRGWLLAADGKFVSDDSAEPGLTAEDLKAIAAVPGQPLTFTCAPWGSGRRMGIDRDADGTLDANDVP